MVSKPSSESPGRRPGSVIPALRTPGLRPGSVAPTGSVTASEIPGLAPGVSQPLSQLLNNCIHVLPRRDALAHGDREVAVRAAAPAEGDVEINVTHAEKDNGVGERRVVLMPHGQESRGGPHRTRAAGGAGAAPRVVTFCARTRFAAEANDSFRRQYHAAVGKARTMVVDSRSTAVRRRMRRRSDAGATRSGAIRRGHHRSSSHG